MLTPGTEIDRYTVERELGSGGMGSVYLVRHRTLGSLHALKLIAPDLAQDPEFRRRFKQEGKVQADLRHPHIVSVTDAVEVEGFFGLVMEYVEGGTLAAYLERTDGTTRQQHVLPIFGQVLSAVGHAHARKVIHRDLKPLNVLLQWLAKGKPFARVTDFGIAKVIDDGAGATKVTSTGRSMGTPRYKSPEQIRDPKSVDAQSDVFSLGIILFEMVTGQMPFGGATDFDVTSNIVAGRFTRPEDLIPDVDSSVARAIETALSVDLHQRFASCEDFAAALGGRRWATKGTFCGDCGKLVTGWMNYCPECGELAEREVSSGQRACARCENPLDPNFNYCWCCDLKVRGSKKHRPQQEVPGFELKWECDEECGGKTAHLMSFCPWCGEEQNWLFRGDDPDAEPECENCASNVDPAWRHCVFCGDKL